MERLTHVMLSKLSTTSEFSTHGCFSEHPSCPLPIDLPPCSDLKVLEENFLSPRVVHALVSSRWSKAALHQQGLLLAGANWHLIPVYIQRFDKAEPAATSHRVRSSSCSSWQWKRWVPAVATASPRSSKPVSTQMSLGALCPTAIPVALFISFLRPRSSLVLEPLDTKNVALSPFLKAGAKIQSYVTP